MGKYIIALLFCLSLSTCYEFTKDKKIVDDPDRCYWCKSIVFVLKKLFGNEFFKNLSIDAVTNLCLTLNIYDSRVCRPTVELYGGPLFYELS